MCPIGIVFCEEPKGLTPEDIAIFAASHVDGPRRLPFLWAHGDYTKLKLIIRSAKKDFELCKPVNVMFFVRNDSDDEITVQSSHIIDNSYDLWKLFHSNYDAVPLRFILQDQIRKRNEADGDYSGILLPRGATYITLKPGQECQINEDRMDKYFDLSKPDIYELTCFLATACFGQYYDPPLQSNTLTFRILEDDEKAENTEGGMNPHKGEEVFKQPKPPKSVFYVYDDDEPDYPWIRTDNGRFIAKPRKIIDISPEMYYREKVPVE